MAEKIFSDVGSAKELANILVCMNEDDLVKYDRDSRRQLCVEIQALCRKFSLSAPAFTEPKRLAEQQDLYDEQAELRGITPQSPLDYLNEELEMEFSSFSQFHAWCDAMKTNDEALENARLLSEPNDEETAEFLRPQGEN
jgi:hypothetical protein